MRGIKKTRWTMRMSLYVGLMLFGVFTISVFIYGQLTTIPRGVQFGNWDVSGYSQEQLQERWHELTNDWSAERWTLTTPEPVTLSVPLTPKQLGLSLDFTPLINRLSNMWEGPFWERAWHRYQLRHTVIPIKVKMDLDTLKSTVQKSWSDIEHSVPLDASRSITNDDRIEYRAETPAYRIDQKRLANELMTLVEKNGFPLVQQNQQMKINHVVPLRTIEPKVTLHSLKQQNIDRKIAEFTTHFPSNQDGRVHNIQSTANVIHERLLAPDEVFDFSEIIQQTEEKHGFKPAPVILNGQFVPGVGGGICQVSTTLYNAALVAGLTIVERQHHSLPVRYVPLGLDATFASGHINFKFQNHTRSHLLIRTETSNHHLTVKLFGSLAQGESYRVESKVLETLPAPIKYVQNASLSPGEQQIITQGKSGFVVETVRIRYENGQEHSREIVSKDHYRPQPTVIAVRNPNQSPDSNGNSDSSRKPDRNQPEQSPSREKQPIIEDGVSGPVF